MFISDEEFNKIQTPKKFISDEEFNAMQAKTEVKPEVKKTEEKTGYSPIENIKKGYQQLGNVAKGVLSSEKGFGESIGQAIAAPMYAKEAEQNNARYMKAGNDMLALSKKTLDPVKRQTYLNMSQKYFDQAGSGIQDIVGELKTTKQVIGEAAGVSLDVATLGGVSSLGKTGVKTALSGGKALAKTAGVSAGVGGAYGATQAMQENKGAGEIAGSALVGAGIGAVAPIAIKGAGKFAQGVKTLASKEKQAEKMITKAEQELVNIENNYAKIRKASKYSKDKLSGSRKRVLEADILPGTVDETGTIRTQDAVKKYKSQVIDGAEGIVKENLAKEGVSVSPDVIKLQLRKEILNSGLEGKQLKRALNAIDDEVEGLSIRSGETGNIPLTSVQDAKINAYSGINFQSDNWVKSEQKAIARAYKNVIENNSKFNVKEVNSELQKYYQDLDYLELLDGRKVKGGKLGKYTAQIAGNIGGAVAGGTVGGPAGAALGTIVGGELASKIKGMMLSKTFGKGLGRVAPKSTVLQKASAKANEAPLQLGQERLISSQSMAVKRPMTKYSNIPEVKQKQTEKSSTILSKESPLIQEARKGDYHTLVTSEDGGTKFLKAENAKPVSNKYGMDLFVSKNKDGL
jgi:hypothetical protein